MSKDRGLTIDLILPLRTANELGVFILFLYKYLEMIYHNARTE